MERNPKLLYWFLAALTASFLLDACHSSKQVAKSSKSVNRQKTSAYTPVTASQPPRNNPKKKHPVHNETAEAASPIIATYAAKLGVSKHDITNYKLYSFIDKWYGTPYKYAGRSHSGIDCSDFVSVLFQNVYDVTVSGAVTDIYKKCTPIKASQLREGDLVFFKINKKSLSHVGVYLQNHKFVHASVHSGVVIDDLSEDYYKKYFRAAGRVLE